MLTAHRRVRLSDRYKAIVQGLLGFLGLALLLLGCGGGGGESATPSPAEESRVPGQQATLDLRIFSPSSLPFGKTHTEWSVEWWQWVFSMPSAENPVLDQAGEKCAVAQRGPVWFLADVLTVSGTATRHCSVPESMALFFPILHVQQDNIGVVPPLTVAELRAQARSRLDGVTDLLIEIDGIPIRNLEQFRFTSPVFSITLPQHNVRQALSTPAAVLGTYFPVVSDGYYVMLKPLPVGEHTIHIRGKLPDTTFPVDGTYQLTIVALILP